MKIIDITRTIQDAPRYPCDEPVKFELVKALSQGDSCDVSTITSCVHVGTHADAFSHYKAGGLTIDKMPLELFCGKCRVITVPGDTLIKKSDIVGKLAGSERIVLRSGGTSYLCEQAAEYIAACGTKAVVTDALSVAPDDNEDSIHSILFEAGVAVVENVTLEGVADGDYLLFAFPAKYGGCDGAPVRAVLIAGE